MLRMLSGGRNVPERHLVRNLLPKHLGAGSEPAAFECPKKVIEYFNE